MARRARNATVDLGLRVKEPLRARLEREAKRNDRSMNAEITSRLEESFTKQDAAGGPELQRIALMMATSFHHAGDLFSKGKPPAEWLRDPECFREAVFGVVNALILVMPNPEDMVIFANTLPRKVNLSLNLLRGMQKNPELFAQLGELMASRPNKGEMPEISNELFEELKSTLESANLGADFQGAEVKKPESE